VERWFGLISQKAIRRGSFSSVKELISKIKEFVAAYDKSKLPFKWTANADSILEKLQQLCSKNSEAHTSLLPIEQRDQAARRSELS
jgi:putative transposase